MASSLFESYVLAGGPLMVPLIFCSILLVGAVIQNLIRFREERLIPRDLLKRVDGIASAAERDRFLAETQGRTAALARVVSIVATRLHLNSGARPQPAEIDRAVDEATIQVADDLFDRLGLLSALYTVAPLLGLLGTILGMMSAFNEFSAGAQRDLSELSQGIQQALVTTLWGLAIAILAYSAAHYFQSRIRRFEREKLPVRAHRIVDTLVAAHASAVSGPAFLNAGPVQVDSEDDDADAAEIPILENEDETEVGVETEIPLSSPATVRAPGGES